MKLSSISVKRRTVKKGPVKKLFANVRKKKHRAATAAPPMSEVEGDVPNLGIARALFVIFVIHVVAIAGIIVHSHWFESSDSAGLSDSQAIIEPARQPRTSGETLPTIRDTDETYFPRAGDTYASIARAHGVSEQELREVNRNLTLSSGTILRIPLVTGNTIVAEQPKELTELRNQTASIEIPVDEIFTAPMVETEAASTAVLVRPGVSHRAPAVETPRERSAEVAAPSGRSHVVKSGDTFWSISQKFKCSPDKIMKVNGISDPRKLKIGMELQIP